MREIILRLSVIAVLITGDAFAQINPSDQIPQQVLIDCDSKAKSYGRYSPPVAAAKNKLIDIGVFSDSEFRNIKIGFCDLAGVEGPVATTSCELDTILLDKKYKRENLSLVLSVTLAHEVKHVLQHQKLKARYGDDFCSSEQYLAEKPSMEAAADNFSDSVAELLFSGRPVEVENSCDAPVAVYLESDDGIIPAVNSRELITVGAHSKIMMPSRAASKYFKFYAQSELHNDRRWVWRGTARASKRLIKGKAYQLRTTKLPSKLREAGPFLLRLTCPQSP